MSQDRDSESPNSRPEFENEGMYATEIVDGTDVLLKNDMFCLFFYQYRYLPRRGINESEIHGIKRMLYEVRMTKTTARSLQGRLKARLDEQAKREDELWNAKYDSERAEAVSVFLPQIAKLPPKGQEEVVREIESAIHANSFRINDVLGKYLNPQESKDRDTHKKVK